MPWNITLRSCGKVYKMNRVLSKRCYLTSTCQPRSIETTKTTTNAFSIHNSKDSRRNIKEGIKHERYSSIRQERAAINPSILRSHHFQHCRLRMETGAIRQMDNHSRQQFSMITSTEKEQYYDLRNNNRNTFHLPFKTVDYIKYNM